MESFLLIQKYLEKRQIAEAQKYLLKLIGNHTEYMIEVRTGIEAVDYILSQKEKWASEKGIDMSIHAEYPKIVESIQWIYVRYSLICWIMQ